MKQTVDICLLLEGTYPFVRGGVSAWLHQLVRNLSELTFALVFLGGRRADYAEPKYALPPNVTHLETHYLEDALRNCPPQRSRLSEHRAVEVRAFHAALGLLGSAGKSAAGMEAWPNADAGASPIAATRLCGAPVSGPSEALDRVLCTLACERGVGLPQFLYSAGAWELICDAYVGRARETSFLDYFWTVRLLHAPLFQLAEIAARAPLARAYHSVSTGYAGFLGALLERRRARAFLVSEHGIYTKERRIDLNQMEWFDPTRGELEPGLSDPHDPRDPREPHEELRELWIHYFESLGSIAYRSANPIVALSEGNRMRQVADGAPAQRTRIISNGIDVAAFERALAARPAEVPMVIGLIGRVVPIKDVKTFIRAIGGVVTRLPNAQGWVVGGADEEPAYARECETLARALGLERRVRFLGHQSTADVLPKLGVLMLTSISEGQPLAILEAFASGVPCIATDVGACRELIEGRDATDRALGRAGRVVPFADAEALARAAVELLTRPAEWQACQLAGLQRVRRYYEQRSMIDAYRSLYRAAIGSSSVKG